MSHRLSEETSKELMLFLLKTAVPRLLEGIEKSQLTANELAFKNK